MAAQDRYQGASSAIDNAAAAAGEYVDSASQRYGEKMLDAQIRDQ